MFDSFLHIMSYFVPVFIVLTILVHVLFAASIYLDATQIERTRLRAEWGKPF